MGQDDDERAGIPARDAHSRVLRGEERVRDRGHRLHGQTPRREAAEVLPRHRRHLHPHEGEEGQEPRAEAQATHQRSGEGVS